jgi:hypothetical protein
VARHADVSAREVRELEQGVRRTLAFLLRNQFLPGPTHLMNDPASVLGGFSGGATDFHVRIDFPQHAGAAILRYLRLVEGGTQAAQQARPLGADAATGAQRDEVVAASQR